MTRPDDATPPLVGGARARARADPALLNWSWASRRNDYAARDWAYNLLISVEPYGVLFTNGDNDTFPLWYVQEVEGIRQGRHGHRDELPEHALVREAAARS